MLMLAISKYFAGFDSHANALLQAAAPAKAVNPLFEKRPKTFGECTRALCALLKPGGCCNCFTEM